MLEENYVYVGASIGISFVSKLIRLYQWGYPYTHIFVIDDRELESFDDLFDGSKIVVYEAFPKKNPKPGFNNVYRDKFSAMHSKNTKYSVFKLNVKNYHYKKAIFKELDRHLGKKYDWLGILGFITRNKNLEDPDKLFCSEYAFMCINPYFKQAHNKPLLRDTKPAEVSPRLFLKIPFLEYVGDGKC